MARQQDDRRPWFLDENWYVRPEAQEYVDVTVGNCPHQPPDEFGVPRLGNDCVQCLQAGFETLAQKLAAVRTAGAVRTAPATGHKALRR